LFTSCLVSVSNYRVSSRIIVSHVGNYYYYDYYYYYYYYYYY